MSVKLTDRPIPDEDYWFNKQFVQEDRAHPVSQSLQRWQIGHNRLESPPGQTIPHAISLQALVLICHLKHRDTIR